MRFNTHNRGFTAFIAVLVSSLALAVGLSIYDLLLRELLLSQTARESQLAIFAADTGVECALYWDNQASLANGGITNGAKSVFGTSTGAQWGISPLNCNAQNITIQGPPAADWTQYANTTYGCPASSGPNWCTVFDANAATTTFSLTYANGTCSTVVVTKWGNPSQTHITSHGYNTCSTANSIRLERILQAFY